MLNTKWRSWNDAQGIDLIASKSGLR